MNGRAYSQNPRKQGKSHHHHRLCTTLCCINITVTAICFYVHSTAARMDECLKCNFNFNSSASCLVAAISWTLFSSSCSPKKDLLALADLRDPFTVYRHITKQKTFSSWKCATEPQKAYPLFTTNSRQCVACVTSKWSKMFHHFSAADCFLPTFL